MTSITYRFFIGETTPSSTLVQDIFEKINAQAAEANAIAEEYGASSAVHDRDGNVIGLVFDTTEGAPAYVKHKGFLDGGSPYFVPRLNTKIGKKLAEQLRKLPQVPPLSKAVIDRLDLRTMVFGQYLSNGQSCLAYSVAGYCQNRILLKIPYQGDGRESNEHVFARIPGWFREVKESEFIAAQGR